MEEMNKIIKDFMNGEHLGFRFRPNQCKYHESYDWLMPVWVKFRDLKFPFDTEEYNEKNYHFSSIANALVTKPITESHHAIHEAIMWYNSLTIKL